METDVICNACPRNCNAIRSLNNGSGFCKAGLLPKIARSAPHFWEEPCISGKKGSGTIFFSECVLRCVYCQNYKISSEHIGQVRSEDEFIEIIKKLESEGVHNINLVNPTHFIETIINCFSRYKPSVPVVYNSSGFEKAESIHRLFGIVNVYLPDFKYGNDKIAKKYSGTDNYTSTALMAIKEMASQTGACRFDSDGMIQSGTIVRHLVLPSNTKNSIEALNLLYDIKDSIQISLMGQYIPAGRAGEFPEINRKITRREYEKVKQKLFELGFEGYVQELSSADSKYVPDFE
ncbi:MAG: radical SAM protein [Bacillota bacterium]|nr:radical SAM protein [Bacillota bacterium]